VSKNGRHAAYQRREVVSLDFGVLLLGNTPITDGPQSTPAAMRAEEHTSTLEEH